jgi:hypothetical protein
MRLMSPALTCMVLTSLSCSCNGTPNQATDTTQAAEQPGLPTHPEQPEPPQTPANTFVAPTTDELAALSTTLADHLAAAHAATDPGLRSTALERAVAIDPFDAITLAELGRAYADSGRLPEAMHSFDLAIRHSDDTAFRAARLLDLGSTLEVLGDTARAAELYQSSAMLHPNDAATARLTALTGGVEVLSHSTCNWTRHGAPPLELCPAYVKSRDALPSTCIYTHPTLELDANTKVALFSHLDPDMAIELYIVNAIIDGVWYSAPLTWVSHPEAKYADETIARLDMRIEQLAPGPEPQVVIEWDLDRRTVDPATKMLETRTTKNLGVLSLVSIEPRWWLGLRTAISRSERELGDSSDAVLTQTSVAVTWMRKTGEFELLRTEHAPSSALGNFALGTYVLLCPSEIDGS